MPTADPKNLLMGTPMGPLDGVVPPNPLIGQAMNAQPPAAPQMPMMAPGQPQAAPMDQKTWDKHMAHIDGLGDIMVGLLGQQSITKKMVIDGMADAVGKGYITPQAAAKDIGAMPDDPQAIRQIITQHFVANANVAKQLYAMKPMEVPRA